jgi:hypothetical protein
MVAQHRSGQSQFQVGRECSRPGMGGARFGLDDVRRALRYGGGLGWGKRVKVFSSVADASRSLARPRFGCS